MGTGYFQSGTWYYRKYHVPNEDGRTVPGDPKNVRCFALCNELHDFFKETCGGTCCRVLTRGMEKDAPERKAQCTRFVEATVKKTAEIILRELEKDGKLEK